MKPGGKEDIWLLCTNSASADYKGITFLGEAARISSSGQFNLWKAERLSGLDIAYRADLPLSLCFDPAGSTCIVHNPHPVEVSFMLRIPSANVEVELTAPSGSHEWNFIQSDKGGHAEGREAVWKP